MKIDRLDHVNLRTTQLEPMFNWYKDVLGLHHGKRPNFPFEGAWMYAGNSPVLHLVGIPSEDSVGSEVALKLEHFAFSATGLDKFLEKLEQMDISYQRSEVPEVNLIQINVWDPDGNHVHIDFNGAVEQ